MRETETTTEPQQAKYAPGEPEEILTADTVPAVFALYELSWTDDDPYDGEPTNGAFPSHARTSDVTLCWPNGRPDFAKDLDGYLARRFPAPALARVTGESRHTTA